MAHSFGFHVGEVVLTDPWAIEAAQALDLQQWHLRRLKVRFDKIDLDGSGNIDYDEFFESIGEMRSPFTDKLFALIGEHSTAQYCLLISGDVVLFLALFPILLVACCTSPFLISP